MTTMTMYSEGANDDASEDDDEVDQQLSQNKT